MLEIQNLSINLQEGFSGRSIVKGISFKLKAGESLGIVGESGSGKTITALSILRLLPPGMKISEGKILLEPGSSIDLAQLEENKAREYRGRMISMIFQEPMTSLNPSMRCGDQIAESVTLHTGLTGTGARSRVFSLLDEVGLPEELKFYRKYPHQLSGGQRQRIMIAMALAGDPGILIADEPTTALDVTVQKKILELLAGIREKRQMSMLFISHDLGVVRAVCDRALVMYRGEIVESGDVSKLFSSPAHPYTKGLLACRPVMGANPYRLPTLSGIMEGSAGNKAREEYTRDDKIGGAPIFEVHKLVVEYSLKKNLLGKSTDTLKAVNEVSFSINEGETLGLIGESGCGKSSLGRSMIRLIRARQGNILYRGKELSSLRGKELDRFRQNVQFIFQDPYSSLNPRITAGASIMEVMRVHGFHLGRRERREASYELLDRVGLEAGHFNRYPHEFSGGQRQRIGLARALASSPELIICDESVSSLDVSVQAMILNLLNDLKESFKLTYLFISHDLSVVRYMSDRIMVMKDGQLVETAGPDEIFNSPKTGYTGELIDSVLD